MNIKQLRHEDDAVSPVIGVILMVAITVILAAVIAAFVLGIGDTDDVAPQTSFSSDVEEVSDGLDVTVEIVSGDSLDADDIEIRNVDDDEVDVGDIDGDDSSGSLQEATDDITSPDEEWGVGESVTFEVREDTDTVTDDFEDGSFNIVWTGDGEDVLWTVDYPEWED